MIGLACFCTAAAEQLWRQQPLLWVLPGAAAPSKPRDWACRGMEFGAGRAGGNFQHRLGRSQCHIVHISWRWDCARVFERRAGKSDDNRYGPYASVWRIAASALNIGSRSVYAVEGEAYTNAEGYRPVRKDPDQTGLSAGAEPVSLPETPASSGPHRHRSAGDKLIPRYVPEWAGLSGGAAANAAVTATSGLSPTSPPASGAQ